MTTTARTLDIASASALARTLSVPGPRPVPVLGPTGNVFRYLRDPIGHTRQLFRDYGPVVALAAGGGSRIVSPFRDCPGTIFVYGPELVRQVRTPHESWELSPLTGTLYPLGDVTPRQAPLKHFLVGPWGVNGDEHRLHRRLMMPAFHKQRIASYCDDMVAITQSVLDRLRTGERHDIAVVMRLLTMRIATKTLFGEDAGDEGSGVGLMLRDALTLLATPLTTLLPLDFSGLPYRRFLSLLARFGDEMHATIARKRAAGDEGDVLSMLIQARDEESGVALTEEELLGYVGSIFAAGHETSGNALSWTLLLLSQHPDVAADLLDELDGVLRGDAPTVDQLGHLPLLERVIKESMRVIPPVPFTWRFAAHPVEVGGYMIPRGTEVLASIYQTHHMPELYPEPERFDPRRWETISPGTYEYIPFNAGPRMCIGAAFAMMEIKIVLAMLLQQYRLECVSQLRVDRFGLPVISPKRGLPMVVHRQDRQFTRGVGGVRGNVREMVLLPH